MLRTFAEAQQIPYPLLSDEASAVIRQYGILNREAEGMGPLDGIPYPGVYVTDADGVVTAKFFHESYKRRDAPALLLDAALGRIEIADDAPRVAAADPGIAIEAFLHGGPLRQGIHRRIVVRFSLPEGLHVYGEPAPEGMFPLEVHVKGPEGLVVEAPIFPPSEPLELASMGTRLQVFYGRFEVQVPIYALSTLLSECSAIEQRTIPIEIGLRYQACSDDECLLPRTETLTLEAPTLEVEVPRLGMHVGHGQIEGRYDSMPHMRRLALRKLRQNPMNIVRFAGKTIALELGALRRRWFGTRSP